MKIKMFILMAAMLIICLTSLLPLNAEAGGWHGGYYGGWHGGTSWNFGINLGGWGAPYYPYYSYPYYPYPYAPYAPYYPNYPPAVIQQQAPAYQQPQPPPPAEEQSYWYFCANPQGYYPYIKRCPSGWMKVVPSAAPPEQSLEMAPAPAPNTPNDWR